LSAAEPIAAARPTTAELMVSALAGELRDGTRVFNGAASFIPIAAFLLARATHAPGLTWAAGSIGVDAHPAEIPESTISDRLFEGSTMLQSSPSDVWAYAGAAKLDTFCFRGVQFDPHGNVNNTVIGPYDNPRVRLPGGGGMADLGCFIANSLLWSTTHDTRTFVERLDHRTCLGWADGGDHRDRLGLPGGPRICVTDLAVLDFHPVSRRMRVRSVHPGTTLEEVVAATGFELVIEGEPPTTPVPSTEQLALIRRLDPTSMRDRG
jgi:glutaconate CoA-transferase subunit B